MKYFAERLRMARVMRGLSMKELVDKLDNKITKQSIGRYEKGEMQPSKDILMSLIDALDLKLDYFDRQISFDIQPEFRKLKKLPKKKQAEVIERTRDFVERYLEAEELVAAEIAFESPNYSCNSLEEAEITAHQMRADRDLGEDPLYNIVEMFEDWGIKVYQDHFGTDSISGMSSWIGVDQAVIVINKSHNIDRQRFTALHELGHLVLDISDEVDEKTCERICDRFAGAMLIPASQLKSELGNHRNDIHLKELELIKNQYGISPQALLYRAKDLGIISSYVHSQKMRYIRSMGWHKKNIGVYNGEENSNRLLQILCKGLSEDAITFSKAASLNNMRVAEFRDLVKTKISD